MTTLSVFSYNDDAAPISRLEHVYNVETLTYHDAHAMCLQAERIVLQWNDFFHELSNIDFDELVKRLVPFPITEICALHALSDIAFAKGHWRMKCMVGTAQFGSHFAIVSREDVRCQACGFNAWNPSYFCAQCAEHKMVRLCLNPAHEDGPVAFSRTVAPDTFDAGACCLAHLPARDISVTFLPLGVDKPEVSAQSVLQGNGKTYGELLEDFFTSEVLVSLIPLEERVCDFLARAGVNFAKNSSIQEFANNLDGANVSADVKISTAQPLCQWPFPSMTIAHLLGANNVTLDQCFNPAEFMCVDAVTQTRIVHSISCTAGALSICIVPAAVAVPPSAAAAAEADAANDEDEEEKPRRKRGAGSAGKKRNRNEPRSPSQDIVFQEMARTGLEFPSNTKASAIPKYACRVIPLGGGRFRVVHMVGKKVYGHKTFAQHFPQNVSDIHQVGSSTVISWAYFEVPSQDLLLDFLHARTVLMTTMNDTGGQALPQAMNELLLTMLHFTLRPEASFPTRGGGNHYWSVLPLPPMRANEQSKSYLVTRRRAGNEALDVFINLETGRALMEVKPKEQDADRAEIVLSAARVQQAGKGPRPASKQPHQIRSSKSNMQLNLDLEEDDEDDLSSTSSPIKKRREEEEEEEDDDDEYEGGKIKF